MDDFTLIRYVSTEVLEAELKRRKDLEAERCPECESTNSQPCGRGGRMCECGCTYGAD